MKITGPDGVEESVEKHFAFVRMVVAKLVRTMNLPGERFDEYYSAGILGLLESAERYRPDSTASFRSYAFPRVRGAIIDSVREMSGIPARAYRCGRAIQGFDQLTSLKSTSDSLPDREQLATLLELVSKGALIFKMSMEESTELPSCEEAYRDQADFQYEQYSTLSTIRELVNELPPLEREILVKHYYDDKSFSQIALESENLSRSWISRLHKRALLRLRQLYLKRMAYDV